MEFIIESLDKNSGIIVKGIKFIHEYAKSFVRPELLEDYSVEELVNFKTFLYSFFIVSAIEENHVFRVDPRLCFKSLEIAFMIMDQNEVEKIVLKIPIENLIEAYLISLDHPGSHSLSSVVNFVMRTRDYNYQKFVTHVFKSPLLKHAIEMDARTDILCGIDESFLIPILAKSYSSDAFVSGKYLDETNSDLLKGYCLKMALRAPTLIDKLGWNLKLDYPRPFIAFNFSDLPSGESGVMIKSGHWFYANYLKSQKISGGYTLAGLNGFNPDTLYFMIRYNHSGSRDSCSFDFELRYFKKNKKQPKFNHILDGFDLYDFEVSELLNIQEDFHMIRPLLINIHPNYDGVVLYLKKDPRRFI